MASLVQLLCDHMEQHMYRLQAIGDHLVTIDTHEKTVFIENMIMRHSKGLYIHLKTFINKKCNSYRISEKE